MAAGDVTVFDEAKLALLDGTHDLDTDTLKCAIITNGTVPTTADASPRLGLYTEVATSTTYLAGGTALTISLTEASGTVTFDPTTNPSWAADAGGGANAYYGLIYNDDEVGAPDAAIAFVDLAGPFDMTAGDLTINWNGSGVFTLA